MPVLLLPMLVHEEWDGDKFQRGIAGIHDLYTAKAEAVLAALPECAERRKDIRVEPGDGTVEY